MNKLRSITQSLVTGPHNRLQEPKEGNDGDIRIVKHKGKYYLAVKADNKWRYFQEINIGDM